MTLAAGEDMWLGCVSGTGLTSSWRHRPLRSAPASTPGLTTPWGGLIQAMNTRDSAPDSPDTMAEDWRTESCSSWKIGMETFVLCRSVSGLDDNGLRRMSVWNQNMNEWVESGGQPEELMTEAENSVSLWAYWWEIRLHQDQRLTMSRSRNWNAFVLIW